MTRSAIVLVVDRLGTGCLGPYGNTWVPTPNFNALAAQSTVWNNALSDAPDLLQAYRGWWDGKHALENSDAANVSGALLAKLADANVATTLLTDAALLAEAPATDRFAEKRLLDLPPPNDLAEDVEQTAMASLFAEAMDALSQQESPFLFWMHSRGMAAPWDAPLALRTALADEEDPDPLTGTNVPSLRLNDDYDPDELLGVVQAYAAQVMVADECLGVLMDALAQHSQREELLLMVTSPRGFPLGEHHIIGDCATELRGELLHVPLLTWQGSGQGALLRNHALIQPPDVAATLIDWFGVDLPSATSFAQSLLPLTENGNTDPSPLQQRDRVISIAGDEQSIRTPAWFLRKAGEEVELYCKPDDRWELNEVSRRCPQIVDQLIVALNQSAQSLATGDENPPLADELVEGLD